jgi:aldehyde:ferredoxin oxidoreductase
MEKREDTGWMIDPEDFERMLQEYYGLRGWDNEGRPTRETMQSLRINA